MRIWVVWTFLLAMMHGLAAAQTMIALSFDDPSTEIGPTMIWQECNLKILGTLQHHQLKAALFVCGKRVQSEAGQSLLKSWDDAGHTIANHSYSHPYLGGNKVQAKEFERELMRTDSMIRGFTNFQPLFRFPYLKEGATVERRDSMRAILEAHGYKNGHVGIDASDWYFSQMLADSMQKNPFLDPSPYRDFYIRHIFERARFYDSLATAVTGHKVRLVLLLHYNLINALFLDDLIRCLKADGWAFIDAKYAYQDPIYQQVPETIPAGESLIWSLAKATGKFESVLRYPAEDSEYEEAKLKSNLQQRAIMGIWPRE